MYQLAPNFLNYLKIHNKKKRRNLFRFRQFRLPFKSISFTRLAISVESVLLDDRFTILNHHYKIRRNRLSRQTCQIRNRLRRLWLSSQDCLNSCTARRSNPASSLCALSETNAPSLNFTFMFASLFTHQC